jgi:hypothetical protein
MTDTPEQAKARAGGNSRLSDERALDAEGRNVNSQPYHPKFCDTARKLGKIGCTELEIADYIGCRKRDLLQWRVEHPEFDAALREGMECADDRVRSALYTRAVGYSVEETKLLIVKGEVQRHTVTKHFPPDVGAGQFWLTNRQSKDWQKAPEYVPPPPAAQDALPTIDDAELLTKIMQLLVVAKARKDAAEKAQVRH